MIRLVLERMITDKAQLQLARTSGIRIDNTLRGSRAKRSPHGCHAPGCRKRLAADGIAYSQFESNLRDGLIGCASANGVRVSVNDQEIDQFLKATGRHGRVCLIDQPWYDSCTEVPPLPKDGAWRRGLSKWWTKCVAELCHAVDRVFGLGDKVPVAKWASLQTVTSAVCRSDQRISALAA
jgi:hypothetical protein